MNYFVLASVVEDDGGAVIESLPDTCPPVWQMHLGESLAAVFPTKPVLRFSSNHPDRRVLQDFVVNTIGLFIISAAARTVLEGFELDNAEFLPVQIADHRGNVVGPDYAILNLVGSIDAVDMAESQCKFGRVDKTQILDLDYLALRESAIPPQSKAFRLRTMLRTVVVREDLAQALKGAQLTGFKLYPAQGWDGMTF